MAALYAVWRGDECLAIGTSKQLAERFGVTRKTVRWWASPTNKKRDRGRRKVAERI